MAIKEVPTNIKTYYKLMITNTTDRKEKAVSIMEELINKSIRLNRNIAANKNLYLAKFNIVLDNYKEYKDNQYTTGAFYKVAKGAFINRSSDYTSTSELYDLYTLAKTQKAIYNLANQIKLYDKLLKLNIKDYTNILKVYYTEVHKKLILEGNGYAFSNNIGWICVNRCVNRTKKKMLDYAGTKKKEKELIAEGKRLYNKEEAEWCLKHGIEYKAEDKRVYRIDEYCYEIPLLNSKLPNGPKLRLEISDYRHTSCRGVTNDDLIERCKYDINKICELPVDLKTKVTLCDKTDKILYTKFIRNENQKSYKATTIDR